MRLRAKCAVFCSTSVFVIGLLFGGFVARVFSSERDFKTASSLGGKNSDIGREVLEPSVVDIPRDNSYLIVRADPTLNPRDGETFIVSVLFRLERLPEAGDRVSILMKTDQEHPYTGWGLGVRTYDTSMRPEVYWRDRYGSGGWHAFDDYAFEAGGWYSFVLVARPGDSLQLYVQSFSPAKNHSKSISGDDKALHELFPSAGSVHFLGGYPMSEMGNAQSIGDLQLGAVGKRHKSFRGKIASAIIGFSHQFPKSREDIAKFLSDGPWAIRSRIGTDETTLYFALQSRDESRGGRALELAGKATWQPLVD